MGLSIRIWCIVGQLCDLLDKVIPLVKPIPQHFEKVGALLENMGDNIVDGLHILARVRICDEVARGT
jgi:hypothetical protein